MIASIARRFPGSRLPQSEHILLCLILDLLRLPLHSLRAVSSEDVEVGLTAIESRWNIDHPVGGNQLGWFAGFHEGNNLSLEESVDNVLHLEIRHTGEILRIRRMRDSQGQTILALDGSLPAGASGPPLHIHFHEREEINVKAGTLGAQVGKEKIIVPTGGAAVLPAGVVHKWWNAGDDRLEISGWVVPAADLDRFLQALFAVLNASSTGRPSIFYLAHVLSRYRDSQAIMLPPRIVQRIVFPVVLLVGRVLGKYRGDNWPGSPASCPGAPKES
jgi:mannose-6-phosphate isomerase-like protein (cupin superfamily)